MITPSVADYLRALRIPLRLGCTNETGWPVVLSLWYLYEDGQLWCATQRQARVVRYLSQNPRCAFEVAADQPPYCGVRGQAIATLDPRAGAEMLERLLVRYLGGTDNALARRLLAQRENEVAIAIRPERVFTWNYTRRMRGSVSVEREHPCPE